MTIGERIKARRKELGISGDALAEVIGVSRSTLFRYESGYIEKLPINHMVPIASALQTTVSYLMGWEEQPTTVDCNQYQRKAMELFNSLSLKRQIDVVNYMRFLLEGDTKRRRSD